jgi:copper(I)-binding protein
MMFMELSASPKVGEPVKGTLKFAKAGELPVVFAVAPLGAKSIDGGGKMTDSQKKDEMDHGSHHMKH